MHLKGFEPELLIGEFDRRKLKHDNLQYFPQLRQSPNHLLWWQSCDRMWTASFSALVKAFSHWFTQCNTAIATAVHQQLRMLAPLFDPACGYVDSCKDFVQLQTASWHSAWKTSEAICTPQKKLSLQQRSVSNEASQSSNHRKKRCQPPRQCEKARLDRFKGLKGCRQSNQFRPT